MLTPSTKCLLPGRNVYHWRRKRNNHRLFSPFSPHLPLSLPRLLPTTCSYVLLPLFPCPQNAASSNSLFSHLPDSWKPHSEWRAHLLWLPLLLLLVLTSLLLITTCHTTVRRHTTVCPVFSARSFVKHVLDHSHTNVGHFKNTFIPVLAFQSHLANSKSCSLNVDTFTNAGKMEDLKM